jgi:hypothetical protein
VYLTWIEASAALMVVGAYGAWVKVGPTGLSGLTSGAHGWITLAAGLLAAGVAWFRRATRSAGAYVAAAGAASFVAVVYDRKHLAAIVGGGKVVGQAAGSGWGLYVALGASISLTVAGLVWVLATGLPWSWLAPEPTQRRRVESGS